MAIISDFQSDDEGSTPSTRSLVQQDASYAVSGRMERHLKMVRKVNGGWARVTH
jgi:hypothetical protein